MPKKFYFILSNGYLPLIDGKGALTLPQKEVEVISRNKLLTHEERLEDSRAIALRFNKEYLFAHEVSEIREGMISLFTSIRERKFVEELSMWEKIQRDLNRRIVIT